MIGMGMIGIGLLSIDGRPFYLLRDRFSIQGTLKNQTPHK